MKDEWQTPKELFDKLNEEFNFDLDVAATKENRKCNWYFDKNEEFCFDSLGITWAESTYNGNYPKNCWMNPPYSRGNINKFCKKAYEESQKGCTVVGLLPSDLSTKWYQNWIFGKAHEVRTTARRVRFVDPDTGKQGGSPRFGSIIVVWKPRIPEKTEFSIYDW